MTTSTRATRHRGIPLTSIRSALNDEWGQLSSDIESQTGNLPLRASTSTLVIITDTGSQESVARETLHQLASAIPSRVLLFIQDTAAETPIADVWAHCTVTSRGRHGACYDAIEIRISPDRVHAIPNIIAVHRLRELPTFVVWDGSVKLDTTEIQSLAGIADRLVIDTESFSRPFAALTEYARFLGTTGSGVFGSDLAWTRISTWRELIAQSFDPRSTRPFAENIRGIDINYDESQASGAILLASWLTSRLRLQPTNAIDSTISLELRAIPPSTGNKVTINLHHSHRTGSGIRSVRILARAESTVARISIFKGDGGTSTARLESTGMPRQERVVHHVDAPRQELIAAELTRYTSDPVYEEALAHAAQFFHLMEASR